MKIINKYEEKLKDSISNKSSRFIEDLLKYFKTSESPNIVGKEEDFITFVLDKREALNLNFKDFLLYSNSSLIKSKSSFLSNKFIIFPFYQSIYQKNLNQYYQVFLLLLLHTFY